MLNQLASSISAEQQRKLTDAKKIVFGKGIFFVRFFFVDNISAQPTHGFFQVTIKAANRSDIAKILRRYHKAEIYCRHHEEEIDFPKFGYRHIAKNFPFAQIFAPQKEFPHCLYLRSISFCYKINGYVSYRKRYRAQFIYHRKEVFSYEFHKSY